MPISIKKKSVIGEGHTEVVHKGKEPKHTTSKVEVAQEGVLLETALLGHVDLQLSATINLGNFNSAKVTVGLSLPTDPDMDKVDKTYAVIKDWVEKKTQTLVNEISGEAEEEEEETPPEVEEDEL